MKKSSYYLLGYKGMKSGNEGIVYMPYIPLQIVETDEQREARLKRERAGKTYARVKRSHPDLHCQGRRGEILDTEISGTKKKYLLQINVSTGFNWKSKLKNVWFNAEDLEEFEIYDKDGNAKYMS